MEKEIVRLDSVDAYNRLYGLETLHPQVAVVNLKNAINPVNHVVMEYGIYALFLKNSKECEIKYGRGKYDYKEGTVTSFAPGQLVEVSSLYDGFQPDAVGLIFHPDLIRNTDLGRKIHKYGFFSYASNEALHVSERERTLITDTLEKIAVELERGVDRHTRQLISLHIDLLLSYCLRFYERQFITREDMNVDVLQKFEKYMDEYLLENKAEESGLPSVKYFADRVFLSPNYFGDLIKKETGRSAQEYIQFRLAERAKDLLMNTSLSISEVGYRLGFSYPQHFNRLFKRQVGLTPKAYREKT